MPRRRPHGQHRSVKSYRGRYYRSFSRACQARASFRLGRKRAQGSCPGFILGGSDALRWATETWDVPWAEAADPIGLNLSNAPPLNPGPKPARLLARALEAEPHNDPGPGPLTR